MICEYCDHEYEGDYSYSCPNCCGEDPDPLHQILLAARRRLNQFAQSVDGAPLDRDLAVQIGLICCEMTPESDEEVQQIYALHPGLVDLDLAMLRPDGTPDPSCNHWLIRVNIEETIRDYLLETVECSRATLH